MLRKDFAPTKTDVYTGYVTLIFGVKCRRNSAAVLSRNIYLVYDHACLSTIHDVGILGYVTRERMAILPTYYT